MIMQPAQSEEWKQDKQVTPRGREPGGRGMSAFIQISVGYESQGEDSF